MDGGRVKDEWRDGWRESEAQKHVRKPNAVSKE